MPWLINTKKNPLKAFKNFMDNVFEIDVAHSKVLGSEYFFNIATSVRILHILISFRTQGCSVNCIFMLFLAFFIDWNQKKF